MVSGLIRGVRGVAIGGGGQYENQFNYFLVFPYQACYNKPMNIHFVMHLAAIMNQSLCTFEATLRKPQYKKKK